MRNSLSPLGTRENQPTGHLDTSIQMERCKHSSKADPANSYVRSLKVSTTSTYARIEFFRAWVQRLAYLHAILMDAKDLGDVFRLLEDRLVDPRHQRQFKTSFQALTASMEVSESQSLSAKAALIRTRKHLQEMVMGWSAWWQNSVTSTYDGTACVRATVQPRVRSSGHLDVTVHQCRRDSIECCIDKFFVRYQDQFSAVVTEISRISESSKSLKEAAVEVAKAMNDPQHLCDDRVCRNIGDLIIAIDSGSVQLLVANNHRDWAPISRALQKNLVNPCRGGEATHSPSSAPEKALAEIHTISAPTARADA
jgi:hypothetical protein